MAATPSLRWKLRVAPDDAALIDCAVGISGMTRSDFLRAAARAAAEALLLEQASPGDSELLPAETPHPNERLVRTMNAPKPWQSA